MDERREREDEGRRWGGRREKEERYDEGEGEGERERERETRREKLMSLTFRVLHGIKSTQAMVFHAIP